MTRMRLCNVLVIGSGAAGLLAAIAFNVTTGQRVAFVAVAVVLCACGHTRLRRRSSRGDENYGEGTSLALEAGCRLMDKELVQFHPTGMVAPEEAAGTLVTEAVRGEGGRLTNASGERFMARHDPARMGLHDANRLGGNSLTETVVYCRRAGAAAASFSLAGAGVVVAEATLRCALERPKTRGCHNRSDFPALDPALQVNPHCQRADGQALSAWSEPVPPVPAEAPDDADLAGRLLE